MRETALEVQTAVVPTEAIRARGVSPTWAVAAVAFLVVSLAVGVLAGPVDIGAGDALRSLLAHLGLSTANPLDPTDAD